MSKNRSVPLLFICLMCTSVLAGEQVGTLTQVEGDVKIFSHPALSPQGPAPHALYESEYYSVQDAKVGDKLEKGNLIRTLVGAKARVVYDNGDQFNVGSGTAYRVFFDSDTARSKTQINLLYGKIRGVIAKGGPRSRLSIKTASATMGVRGTDFFIAHGGRDGETEVSILRGEVELGSLQPHSQAVQVKSGYSASVASSKDVGRTAALALRRMTQEDLAGIQKSAPKAAPAEQNPQSPLIQKLEAEAAKTTLRDIQAADPKLYAQLSLGQGVSAASANAATVQSLSKEAPHAARKRKPFKSELENLEDGVYEKYFKDVQ